MGMAWLHPGARAQTALGRFVSRTPGYKIVLEVYEGYWWQMPQVKRLVMKGMPRWTTWLTMLQNGGTDFALSFHGPAAEGMKRDPYLTLEGAGHASMFWVEFPDPWYAKSASADIRGCLAINQAPLDLQAINEAA